MSEPKELRRLVFDIETSPCILWAWRPGYQINVPHTNIIRESAIICVSYKFVGDKKVKHLTWDHEQNDKELLEQFIPIMQEADIVIGHNSDSFDIKWLRTQCLLHGVDMPPDFVTVDTYKEAKKYFRFNSNSLKYISGFLGVKEKLDTSKNLWQKVVFENDKKAMKEMLTYCDRDVEATEEIFLKMVPYVQAKGHNGLYISDCPHCGGSNTRLSKRRVSAAGAVKAQFQCQGPKCGKYHTIPMSKWLLDKPIKR